MRSNVTILGWCFIAWNALSLVGGLIALIMCGLFGGFAAVMTGHEGHAALPIFAFIGLIIFLISAVLSVPGLVIGWGLITFQRWARIGGIILSALHLTAFPLGTALGIFGLVTLCDTQTAYLFDRP